MMKRLLCVAGMALLAGCGEQGVARPAAATQGAQAGIAAGPEMMDKAPDFELPDSHGAAVKLSELEKRGPVLVIFYLGYNCPRCVSHLRQIEERMDAIRAAGGQVVAISPDSVERLKESADAFGDFPFPLLADPEMKAFRAYGLVYGKETIFHGCYVIDKAGRVALAMKSSHPYDNMEAIVGTIRGTNDGL